MAKYLNTDGLTHLVELIKNGMAPKEHKHSYDDMVEDTAPVAKQITGEIINSDLINGHGSIGEMTVFGNTRQNLWQNPSGTNYAITATNNEDGSFTISGTASERGPVGVHNSRALKPNAKYTVSIDKNISTSWTNNVEGAGGHIEFHDAKGFWLGEVRFGEGNLSKTFSVPSSNAYSAFCVFVEKGFVASGTYRVMLREATEEEIAAAQQTASTLQEGGTADLPQDHPVTLPADPGIYAADDEFDWCPPGINGVEPTALLTAGKNLLARLGDELPHITNGITFSDNGDGGIRISGTASTAAYFNFYSLASSTAPFIPAGIYALSMAGRVSNVNIFVKTFNNGIGSELTSWLSVSDLDLYPSTGAIDEPKYLNPFIRVEKGATVDTVVYPQLESGSTATAYEPPAVTKTTIDMQGHALYSLPDGTRDELRIDGTGKVDIAQNCYEFTLPSDESLYTFETSTNNRVTVNLDYAFYGTIDDSYMYAVCDKFSVRNGGYDDSKTEVYAAWQTLYIQMPGKTKSEIVAAAAGAKVVYKLAGPKTVELGSLELPSVKSEKMNVWIDANLPTQLESTIIDLPILPIASGGTGAGNTEEARSNLDVYSKAEVDEKFEDISIDEVVPISKGGTGKITAKAAQNALLGVMEEVETDPGDDTTFVMRYASPNDTKGAVFVRKASHVWNYIASKIRSTFGFSSSNVLPISHGGTGVTSAANIKKLLFPKENAPEPYAIPYFGSDSYEASYMLPTEVRSFIGAAASNHTHNYAGSSSAGGAANSANELVSHYLNNGDDLNDCKDDAAFYYSIGGNTVKNKPRGVEYFGMFVMRSADGYRTQILCGSDNVIYTRYWNASSWSSWVNYYSSANKPTPSEIGAAASSHKHSAADITSGTLPLTRGGTGGTDAATARTNLSVYSKTEVDAKLEGAITALDAYPIGSVYISYVSTSPASLFGGTWTAITGVFPYFNAGTSTGGSNDAIVVEHTHTATAANAGSHTHGASTNSAGAHAHTIGADDDAQFREHSGTSSVHRAGATGAHRYPGTSSAGSHSHSVTVNSAGDHTHTITVASAGSAGTGKNMPAYQTLYAWRRTA